MRPRLIREVPNDDLLPVVAGPGPGQLRLRLFDDWLLPAGELDLPALDPRLRFAPLPGHTGSLIAAGDEVLLVERDGTVRWRRREDPDPEYPEQATPYVDPGGTLWLWLPGKEDRIAVVDPATGDRLAEYADGENSYGVAVFSHGSPAFFAHPGGDWTGLHVAAGDQGSTSFRVRYADGRITAHEFLGEALAGFDTNGTRYLAAHHDDEEFAMRSFPDGEVLASCALDDIPGYQAGGPYRIDYGAFMINDDLVLACVEGDGIAEDVLLSSHTLHWVDTVRYPSASGLPWRSARPGHWLTRGSDATRLWALP
ncbi:hypothetical protein [Catellatospora chokoriensis]|uniref:Uncharacterized protein n=1 Tax=Catellatospora chokoriensis TaxID=310353 RepID=A0A8J3NST5_9ACTN|nr:hypothetical protein [Catellatospora chokoriensis]GIF91347.1 hypothetical protein Cch02nite_47910 [Catellatospora chokoriensis]